MQDFRACPRSCLRLSKLGSPLASPLSPPPTTPSQGPRRGNTRPGAPRGFGRQAPAVAAGAVRPRFAIPASARELIVVSSPTYDPPDYLASLRTFSRTSTSSPWKRVFPAWQTEIGSGEIVDVRHEGDHARPTGVYGFGLTMYGTLPDPGRPARGLPPARVRGLVGRRPLQPAIQPVRARRLWDDTPVRGLFRTAVDRDPGGEGYPYLAVIDYNVDPTISGSDAPGSGYSFTPGWTPRHRAAWHCRSPSSCVCCAGWNPPSTRSSRSVPTPKSAACARTGLAAARLGFLGLHVRLAVGLWSLALADETSDGDDRRD